MTRLSGAILIGLLACALGVTACGGSEPVEGEADMVEAAPRAPTQPRSPRRIGWR